MTAFIPSHSDLNMTTFELHRLEDASGISGTGVVAQGVVFHDGSTVVAWQTEHKSVCVYKSISEAIAIHGHGGKTKIVQTANVNGKTITHLQNNRAQDEIESIALDFSGPNHAYVWQERDKVLELLRAREITAPPADDKEIEVTTLVPVVAPPEVSLPAEKYRSGEIASLLATPRTGKFPPTGKPSLRLLLDTLHWISGHKTSAERFQAAMHKPDSEDYAPVKAMTEAIGFMPISNAAQWTFTTIGIENLTSGRSLAAAYMKQEFDGMCQDLFGAGLGYDEIMPGSLFAKKSRMNKVIAGICDGTWPDSEFLGPSLIPVDRNEIMNVMKIATTMLPADKAKQMYSHVTTNYDAHKDKALDPMRKVLKRANGDSGERVQQALETMMLDGRLPIAVAVMPFLGRWRAFWSSICSWSGSDTTPPSWIAEALRSETE